MTDRRYMISGLVSLLAIGVSMSGLRAGPAEGQPPPSAYSGALSLSIDNDVFVNSDDNYTSGVGLSWVSAAADSYGPKAFVSTMVRGASFLPAIGKPSYRDFVSFALSQEIYTPSDIEAPVAPPDQQPYAGVLALDTSVYAIRERMMHAFTLRLGCVGPCSGAEQVQRSLHEWIGSPVPQGWDSQLENEILLNLNYAWHWRIHRRTEPRRVHYDFSMNVDGGFGNYYIGASSGVMGRVGHDLPDTFGASGVRVAGTPGFVGLEPPAGRRWQYFFFVGFRVFAVGRFLPVDGNTFVTGPRIDRDDLFANLWSGFVLAHGSWQFSWSLNNLAGLSEFESSRAEDYGTLRLSYFF